MLEVVQHRDHLPLGHLQVPCEQARPRLHRGLPSFASLDVFATRRRRRRLVDPAGGVPLFCSARRIGTPRPPGNQPVRTSRWSRTTCRSTATTPDAVLAPATPRPRGGRRSSATTAAACSATGRCRRRAGSGALAGATPRRCNGSQPLVFGGGTVPPSASSPAPLARRRLAQLWPRLLFAPTGGAEEALPYSAAELGVTLASPPATTRPRMVGVRAVQEPTLCGSSASSRLWNLSIS